MNLSELRLHSNISWNRSAIINQLPASIKHATKFEVRIAACIACGVSGVDFESKSRHKEIVTARMIASNYLLKYHGMTLAAVGKFCGDRDHATILVYKKRYANLIDSNDIYLKKLSSQIQRRIIAYKSEINHAMTDPRDHVPDREDEEEEYTDQDAYDDYQQAKEDLDREEN